PDLPRQPGARRRRPAARLWRQSQARHGRSPGADRPVQMAPGHSLAAKHVEARRLRADAGRQAAGVNDERAGLLADPAEVRAILVSSAKAGSAISYSEVLELLGHHFTRPKMRALCKVLAFVDDEAEERG